MPDTCPICLGTPCALEGTPVGSFISGAHIPRYEMRPEELFRQAAERERTQAAEAQASEEQRQNKVRRKAERHAKWLAEGSHRKKPSV